MKKFVAVFLALIVIVGVTAPAEARVFVGVGVGYPGYYGYPAYYPGYYGYPYYYSGYYGAPPPVAYAPVPVAVPVAPVVTPAVTPSLGADQTSETFIDASGRTCRQFQATSGVGPANGTACLMSDGTWRTVTE